MIRINELQALLVSPNCSRVVPDYCGGGPLGPTAMSSYQVAKWQMKRASSKRNQSRTR